MSKREIELAFMLLSEHFGAIVASVGQVLMRNGLCALSAIADDSALTLTNVRNALITLIRHHFVSFEANDRSQTEYRICVQRVLTILRYPKYIYVAKMLFGDEGEYMVEEMLKHGQLCMSDTIQRVVNRLAPALSDANKVNLPNKVFQVFKKFTETRFIQRVKTVISDSNGINSEVNAEEDDSLLYELPDINMKLIKTIAEIDVKEEQPVRKKRKLNEEIQSDANIYWRINLSRFHQYMRDQIIIEAIKNRYDDSKAAEIARIILRLSEVKTHSYAETTSPLSKHEILKESINTNVCVDETQLDNYLHCFQDDNNFRFITKTESRGDGMYSIHILRTLDKLVDNCLSSIIQDRYCAKSARIYRLLLEKKYLQQKQIEDFAMIPSKEAKQLTYSLYVDNMVKVLQCPKTSDYAPSRTYFLFAVDRINVSRNILNRCYQAVYNAITRRLHEHQQHKALLERKTIIDALISNLQQQQYVQDVEQQIQDLRDSFSTHDNELLEKVNTSVKWLEHSELQSDETIFLLQSWLFLNKMNSKDAVRIEVKDQFIF